MKKLPDIKVVCETCGWTGMWSEVQSGRNPFNPDEPLQGCPACDDVNTMRTACDEPGCWHFATCGTPTPNGYRSTCGKHVPKEQDT